MAEYKQQKVEMDIISAERCQEKWGNNLGPLTQTQICASRKGVTTCKGDSCNRQGSLSLSLSLSDVILLLPGGPLYTRATQAPGEDNTLAPWTLTG